jgi:diguanylate cyclase (GGDEF)-like protein/PAS domain S-box-containing protein
VRTSRAPARHETRLARALLPATYAATPLAVGGGWFLQRAHLLGDVSLAVFVPLVALTAVANAASQIFWNRRRGTTAATHVRIGGVMVTTTVVVSAAGWGPFLAIAYAIGGIDVLRTMGSTSARPAIAWMVGCIALGQVAVALGFAPTILSEHYAHAVAAVGVTCLVLVVRVLGSTEAIAEDAQAELREHGEQFQALVQHAMDIIGVLGERGTIDYVSPAIGTMLGYEPADVEGDTFLALVQQHDADSAQAFLDEVAGQPDTALTRELALRHRDGSTRLAAVTLTRRSDTRDGDVVVNVHDITTQRALEERLRHDALHDPVTGLANRTAFLDEVEGEHDTALTRELALRHRAGSTRLAAVTLTRRSDTRDGDVVVNIHDITTQRALEERLRHDALHDPVTGLANRTAFLDAVKRACARATRERSTLAVLYVDLDGFKRVNDSFGHEAGDRVLVATAELIASCVRAADVVARLGGDEFCVLLERVATLDETIEVADRVIATLAETRPGGADGVTASIGIALNPAGDLSVSELLRRADEAMYDAKRSGRGRWATNARVLQRAG